MIRLVALAGALLAGILCLPAGAQLPNAVKTLGTANCPLGGNDPATISLLHFDGTNGSTTFTDSSSRARTFAVGLGTVALNVTTKKFGTASGNFTTSGALINQTNGTLADYAFGTGPFTIDAWVIPPTGTGGGNFTGTDGYSASAGWHGGVGSSTQKPFFQAFAAGGAFLANYQSTGSLLTQSVFNHVAWVRNGSSFFFFLNGTSQSLTVSTAIAGNSIPNGSFAFVIGNSSTFQPAPFVDEFRISTVARWTANFTPPTLAYCP